MCEGYCCCSLLTGGVLKWKGLGLKRDSRGSLLGPKLGGSHDSSHSRLSTDQAPGSCLPTAKPRGPTLRSHRESGPERPEVHESKPHPPNCRAAHFTAEKTESPLVDLVLCLGEAVWGWEKRGRTGEGQRGEENRGGRGGGRGKAYCNVWEILDCAVLVGSPCSC